MRNRCPRAARRPRRIASRSCLRPEFGGQATTEEEGERRLRHQGRPTATSLLAQAERLADRLGSDQNHWHTGFGPRNVVLHRLSAELDLDSISYVMEHGRIDVDRMPVEHVVSHHIDYAHALCLTGWHGDDTSPPCSRLTSTSSTARRSGRCTGPVGPRRAGPPPLGRGPGRRGESDGMNA